MIIISALSDISGGGGGGMDVTIDAVPTAFSKREPGTDGRSSVLLLVFAMLAMLAGLAGLLASDMPDAMLAGLASAI